MRYEEKEDEITPVLTQSVWMRLAEMRPLSDDDIDYSTLKADSNYDWSKHRLKYSQEELDDAADWINKQKKIHSDSHLSSVVETEYEYEIVLPETLNSEQKKIYEMVRYHNEHKKQLLMIMLGTAGTGKSYTIKAITHYLGKHLKKAAPTAKAAFIIAGETLHSLLSIPVQIDNATLTELSGTRLKTLQEKFKYCEFLIIDEFSMLSQAMMAKINQRLREIRPGKKDLLFGGISVILAGDPAQLQPVKASKLYDSKPKSSLVILGD